MSQQNDNLPPGVSVTDEHINPSEPTEHIANWPLEWHNRALRYLDAKHLFDHEVDHEQRAHDRRAKAAMNLEEAKQSLSECVSAEDQEKLFQCGLHIVDVQFSCVVKKGSPNEEVRARIDVRTLEPQPL